MAEEVAKRRAARRRKILENSEERLKKLMCKDAINSTDTNGPLDSIQTFPEELATEEELSGSNIEDKKLQLTFENSNKPFTFKLKLEDNVAKTEPIELPNEQIRDHYHEKIDTSPKTPESIKYSPNNYQFPKILTENRTFSRPRRESIRNSTQLGPSPLWISFGVIRYLLSIFLGIVIRSLIYAEIDFSFTKSIFFPFVLLEIGLLSYEYFYVPSKANNQGMFGGALTGALMLCGIHQTTIVYASNVVAISKRIFEDLIMYLFTFLILHWFMDIFVC